MRGLNFNPHMPFRYLAQISYFT